MRRILSLLFVLQLGLELAAHGTQPHNHTASHPNISAQNKSPKSEDPALTPTESSTAVHNVFNPSQTPAPVVLRTEFPDLPTERSTAESVHKVFNPSQTLAPVVLRTEFPDLPTESSTAKSVHNVFNPSQTLAPVVLRTEFPDLTNESVLHAHLHKDDVFQANPDIFDVALGESEYFVKKIFKKYGPKKDSLAFEGLRDLMNQLGLLMSEENGESMAHHEHQEVDNGHGDKGMKHDEESMVHHEGHNSKHGVQKRSLKQPIVISHNHGDHSECHALGDLLSAFHFDLLTDLDQDQFLLLCPALIDQLDNNGCRHKQLQQHHHGNEHHQHGQHHNHGNPESADQHSHNHSSHHHDDVSDDDLPAMTSLNADGGKEIPAIVWAYSVGSVTVISLVGLLGVAVIPIMRKMFYKSMLQFLIALAIGALSGDALLHLLPHALSPAHPQGKEEHGGHVSEGNSTGGSDTGHQHGSEADDNHGTVVWKGLVALLGLLFFFLAERILMIVTERRTQQQAEKKAQRKAMLLEMSSNGMEQVIIISQPDDTEQLPIRETAILSDSEDDEQYENSDNKRKHSGHDEARVRFLTDKNPDRHHQGHAQGHEQGHGHGEGHGHGHSHGTGEIPRSMSAVALMVIFGDGIHNFSDGLAIGAAFANSITGGLSTAVAVFCHELPHEIGDFAMLLNSGMAWKQAMLYNVLSSILCLLGMVVGVFLGNLDNAVLWIFPAVAGMFLYISLADMLPELRLGKEKMVRQLLTQCVGIAVGSGIMLTIAVFEHDLKTLLD